MKFVIILGLVAACCVQDVVCQLTSEQNDECLNVQGFRDTREGETLDTYHRVVWPGSIHEREFTLHCVSSLMWSQALCTCIPNPQDQGNSVTRPFCEDFMTSTFIQSSSLSGPAGLKALTPDGLFGTDITKTNNQMCLTNGAMVGIYYAAGNDLGDSFEIDTTLTIQGLPIVVPGGTPIVLIDNGCTYTDSLGVSTEEPSTLTLSYTQNIDTYTVVVGGVTASCRPTVFNGLTPDNRVFRELSVISTPADRLQIEIRNRQITLSVNGLQSLTSVFGICTTTSVALTAVNAEGRIPGTRCLLTFGIPPGSGNTVCFQTLDMQRDCPANVE